MGKGDSASFTLFSWKDLQIQETPKGDHKVKLTQYSLPKYFKSRIHSTLCVMQESYVAVVVLNEIWRKLI